MVACILVILIFRAGIGHHVSDLSDDNILCLRWVNQDKESTARWLTIIMQVLRLFQGSYALSIMFALSVLLEISPNHLTVLP